MNVGAARGVASCGQVGWEECEIFGGEQPLTAHALDGRLGFGELAVVGRFVALKMLCCVAFCEEASFPSKVVGPRDLAPLARADSDLREVVILRVG